MKTILKFALISIILFSCKKDNEVAPESSNKSYTTHKGSVRFSQSNSTIPTSDGNLIIIGQRGNAPMVMKVNKNGEIIWRSQYAQQDSYTLSSAAEALDGSIYLCGSTKKFSTLTKISSQGKFLWDKKYKMPLHGIGKSIILTSDGNILIAAENWGTEVVNGGLVSYSYRIELLKVNPEGEIIWNEIYKGPGYDYIANLMETSKGEYLLTCNRKSNSNGGIYYLNTDTDGKVIWENQINGSMEVHSTIETRSGEFLSCGGNNDLLVVKLDNAGNLIDTFLIYNSNKYDENYDFSYKEGYSILENSDGTFSISGIENAMIRVKDAPESRYGAPAFAPLTATFFNVIDSEGNKILDKRTFEDYDYVNSYTKDLGPSPLINYGYKMIKLGEDNVIVGDIWHNFKPYIFIMRLDNNGVLKQ